MPEIKRMPAVHLEAVNDQRSRAEGWHKMTAGCHDPASIFHSGHPRKQCEVACDVLFSSRIQDDLFIISTVAGSIS
jgi:hypothetical protein